MSYVEEIAGARESLAESGAPITLRRQAKPSSYDPVNDASDAGAPVTNDSVAVKIDPGTDWPSGALGARETAEFWIAAAGMTLEPWPGDELVFAGETWSVALVKTLGPDGTPILFRCLGGK